MSEQGRDFFSEAYFNGTSGDRGEFSLEGSPKLQITLNNTAALIIPTNINPHGTHIIAFGCKM